MPVLGSSASARSRTRGTVPVVGSSSRPSIWLDAPVDRAWRSSVDDGRSGDMLSAPRALALASSWPLGPSSITSRAAICSRTRSSDSGPIVDRFSDSRSAASRVLATRSVPSTSKVLRPSDRPASSAPATRASNQVSMLRETNCTDTV